MPAALEVAGLIPVYGKPKMEEIKKMFILDSIFFNSIDEMEILRIFGEYSLISDEQFAELAKQLIEHLAE